MRNINVFVVVLVTILIAAVSCGKSHDPVSPDIDSQLTLDHSGGSRSHSLMGFSLFRIDPSEGSVESIPVRNLTDHWNVLTFLENGPCTTCIQIMEVEFQPDDTISFRIRITHPFSGLNLTGFDVRGIAMFNGNKFFPETGVVVSDSALGDIRLIYAEGYTTLYNPTTWGDGPGGLQGYLPGKFATDAFPTATLNPYRTFKSAGTENDRNAFYASDFNEQEYRLVMPDDTPFILGYAVDACWAPPDTVPVTDPLEDFPISANCPEPWKLQISKPYESDALTPNGGMLRFQFYVYDYTGVNSHNIPLMECPGIFDGLKQAEFVDSGDGYTTWQLAVDNDQGADVGKYPLVVSVEDKQNESAPEHLDLTAYNVSSIWVHEPGWAIAWGNDYIDRACDVASDSYYTYVTGYFYNTVDFDPGEGVEEHTSMGYEDAYLSKFDPDGNLIWTRVWGADHHEAGLSIEVYANNVYVCGYFNSTVDFDPGPGVTEFTSYGDWDSYISKFDLDGNLLWAQAWGSSMWDQALDISVIESGVFACGYFRGTCDFDPGSGTDEWVSNPGASYVTKFDLDGNHLWARAWAGDGGYDDVARALNADTGDGEPLIFVAGEFDGTVDLDPGGGIDSHTTPSLYQDVYLSCFDDDGDFQWGVTWGGDSDDHAYGVDSIYNDNRILVTGNFMGSVDFDPGTGPGQEDIHTANSDRDAYLSCFSPTGTHNWTNTWGGGDGIGNDDDTGYRVIADSFGYNIHVVGTFHDTVEFGPSSYVESEFTSNGEEDIFITCFDMSGNFSWARAVGGPGPDYAWGVCTSQEPTDRFIYIAGSFSDTVDFNPYSGKYELTSLGDFDSCLIKYREWGHW